MALRIPFNKPFIVGRELENIAQAVKQGHLSANGPFTRACNQWLEQRLGCKRALLTHSCTAALEMAAILSEVLPGEEVIMPSYTFSSTATAFVLRCAVPVFVDIRPDTLNIDETLIERSITDRTKVIVTVHYGGRACEMDRIMEIAARHHLCVVEDAAQALLSTYRGKYLGSIGHIGCLSFHETKNVISGEGGALLINDERLADRAEIIGEKGTNRSRFFRGEIDKYTWVDIGSSYQPSELVGAFLDAQLEKADEIMAMRVAICERYRAGLRKQEAAGHFRLPLAIDDAASSGNGHLFFLIVDSLETRSALIEHLRKRDIMAVFHYVPLHSSPAGLRFGRTAGALPVTDYYSDRVVRLPMFFRMTNSEIDAVIEAIEEFFNEKAAR